MGNTYHPKDAELVYRLQRQPDTASTADVARLVELALKISRHGLKDPTKQACEECGAIYFTFGHLHRKTCGDEDCRKHRNKEKSRLWNVKHGHLR